MAALKKFGAENGNQPIRLDEHRHGCGCASELEVMMAPSEIQSNDVVIEAGGITFVIEPAVMRRIKPVLIDYQLTGFVIKSSVMLVSEDNVSPQY